MLLIGSLILIFKSSVSFLNNINAGYVCFISVNATAIALKLGMSLKDEIVISVIKGIKLLKSLSKIYID